MKCTFEATIISDITTKPIKDGESTVATFTALYKEHDDITKICKVATFGNSAESTNNNFKKGDSVVVDGSVVLNTWTSQDGQQKSGLSVNAVSVKAPPKEESTDKKKP